jgi:limonene-1,2-epoxide hydrolase
MRESGIRRCTGMAETARDPETIVREFCASWPERSIDRLLAFFTDDALYHNMPMEPVTGKDGIREVMNLFVPAEDLEAEIVHLAVRGNVVFTERIDRMTLGGKRVVLPCAGVFEIRDGKIAAWRDYFDLATWQRQAG